MSPSAPPAAVLEPARPALRVLAAFEVAAIVGLIFAIIWVKPLDRADLDLSLEIAVGILLVGSPIVHRDSLKRLGLRVDNFFQAFGRVLPVSLIAAAISIGAGYYLLSTEWPGSIAIELKDYFIWAIAQQYALQSVILRRLEDAGLHRRAPLAASVLFSVVHAPNPGLLILTFLGGLLWCSTFRKHPNLLAVSISHAVLAVVVVSTLPYEATGWLRIGPAYIAP
jgi:membrane protease YdiL (CAAX protease family)